MCGVYCSSFDFDVSRLYRYTKLKLQNYIRNIVQLLFRTKILNNRNILNKPNKDIKDIKYGNIVEHQKMNDVIKLRVFYPFAETIDK